MGKFTIVLCCSRDCVYLYEIVYFLKHLLFSKLKTVWPIKTKNIQKISWSGILGSNPYMNELFSSEQTNIDLIALNGVV